MRKEGFGPFGDGFEREIEISRDKFVPPNSLLAIESLHPDLTSNGMANEMAG